MEKILLLFVLLAIGIVVYSLLHELFKPFGIPRVYSKNPLWKRPWENVPQYHIRIGKLRGDSDEYVQEMITLYEQNHYSN